MRFVFLPSSTVPIHANCLEERPLGGTETGIVRLTAALSNLGHDVTVLTQLKNPPLSKPLYVPMSQVSDITDTDVLVVIREWRNIFCGMRTKARLFWSGEASDQPHTFGLGDKRIADKIDAFLAVSTWQADSMSSASGFPRRKMCIIKNGVHTRYFSGDEPRNPKRLIYSSTPYRGLEHLLRLFPRIKQQVPDAQLAIFSGYDVYSETAGGVPFGYDQAVRDLERMKREFAAIPGVTYRGSIKQSELAREFKRSAVLAYPNTFAETSCITALEAQYAGCVPVTTDLGALAETIGEGGIVIGGKPGTGEYDTQFVSAVVKLLNDPAVCQDLSQKALANAAEADWEFVAKRLLHFLAQRGLTG